MRITKALFEGLLRLDGPEARPAPGLAESWNTSADGKIYTFHLRTNLMWSTGEKITARDVLYSWFRALDPATASLCRATVLHKKCRIVLCRKN